MGETIGTKKNEPQKVPLKKQGFYKKAVWLRLRQQALERDHHLCQECLKNKRFTPATEVHHIKPAEEYPELALTLENLKSLCWACHEKTKIRAKSGKKSEAPNGVRVIKI